MEKQLKDGSRPRTEREENLQKVAIASLIVLLIAGVVAFLTFYICAPGKSIPIVDS